MQILSAKSEIPFPGGSISAIDVLFLHHPKCLDLLFIYLSGLMTSIVNLQLLKHASVEDKLAEASIDA
jgi:hypothetical protein